VTADARAALRSWVLERNPDLAPDALREDTPLVAARLLTSVQLLDLLLLIESLRGAPVDAGTLRPGDFRDLDTIHRRFLAGHQGA
jgi:hypothetical protein